MARNASLRRARAGLACALAALAVAATGGPAHAGAWTQKKGEGQLITTVTRSVSNKRFDAGAKAKSSPAFRKVEVSPTLDYGLTDDVTLVAQPRWQSLSAEQGTGRSDRGRGLSDTDLGLRFGLWSGPTWAVSLQPLVRVPLGYDPDDRPARGSGRADYEMRLLAGTAFNFLDAPAFAEAQLAGRNRTGAPADEVRLDLTFGVRPSDAWLLLAQLFETRTVGDAGAGESRFRTTKLQGSVVRAVTETSSVQLGAFRTVAGREAGQETALLLALWTRF